VFVTNIHEETQEEDFRDLIKEVGSVVEEGSCLCAPASVEHIFSSAK